MECSTCAAKPGSPVLCAACLNNRELISALLAMPRYEKYVNTVQCKGCKMIQKNRKNRTRHKEKCPVPRIDALFSEGTDLGR